ncbi:xanthotoxin 5-hydroxylase CYP82C4 [Medicago truncatula]|uniref:Cytochrome P450 family protein n=2 Tax=Medicago truncatula TaxID=3880 RepID=A0A072U7S9_MEDTR|nr:xanthotoxin 5-hydroxylase CYP82C4 [Medicago truncatula]KEH25406.1 cytochrome P450 family protein [Medicago truncatula]
MDIFLSQPINIVLAILLVLIYNIWKIKKPSNKFKGMKPPEPLFALPLIGHLHLLGKQIPLARIFASFSDKYGPVFQIRLGAYPALIISNKEAIKECFTTNDKILASRPKSSHGIHLGYNYAGFSFAPSGPYFSKLKKITMVELLSSRRLESLRHVYESEIHTWIKDLSFYVKGNNNVKVVISEWLKRLSFNTITKMIGGKRYFENLNVEDVEAHGNIVNLIREFMLIAGDFVPKDLIPIIGWFGFEGQVLKSMKRVGKDLETLVGSWIEEHIVNNSNEKHDFIDVMLSVIEDDRVYGHNRDTIIKANITDLMLAGSDSTSTTLTWIVALLLNNRNVLKRAQEEIDHHIGKGRRVESSDIKNLVYLQAILKETLRLYPAAPLLAPHEATEDCNIQGYYVPKGTRVFFNVWKLHRDPSIWSEPEKFLPERFINENGEIDHESHHFEYLPFGLGRRACPGSLFATQNSLITLACLLHGFDLEVPMDEVVDMREGLGITLPKLTPLQVVLTPRLPFELYQ